MNDTRNDDLEGMGKIANMIDIDAAADQAAQDEADHTEMVDATIHRGVSCHHQTMMQIPGKPSIRQELTGEKPLAAPRQCSKPLLPEPPLPNDFVKVEWEDVQGVYEVSVKLSDWRVVATFRTKADADHSRLTIIQVMLGYYARLKGWELVSELPLHQQEYLQGCEDIRKGTPNAD